MSFSAMMEVAFQSITSVMTKTIALAERTKLSAITKQELLVQATLSSVLSLPSAFQIQEFATEWKSAKMGWMKVLAMPLLRLPRFARRTSGGVPPENASTTAFVAIDTPTASPTTTKQRASM